MPEKETSTPPQHSTPTHPANIDMSTNLNLPGVLHSNEGQTPTALAKPPLCPGHTGTNEDSKHKGLRGVEKQTSTPPQHALQHANRPEPPSDLTRYEDQVDRKMVRLLLDLSTVSQIGAAAPEAKAPDANALRLPVNERGKAITDNPVADLAAEYKRASHIKEQKRRVRAKLGFAIEAQTELRAMRYARRGGTDLGTQEGRVKVARFARVHGSRRAAEAWCHNPQDPKSVASMQRNVQRYLLELIKLESKGRA